MCLYVALVVRGGDASTIDRVLRRHGRQARPFANATLAGSLLPGEAIISDLMSTPGVQQAGLLLHFYSGDLEEETIEPLRKMVPASEFASSLKGIGEDQLLMAA